MLIIKLHGKTEIEKTLQKYLDKIEISKITDFQVKFLEGLRADHSDIFDEINNTGNFSDESDKKIEDYLEKFTANYS